MATAVPVEGGPASETAPAGANLLERLGPGPLLEGLLADRKERTVTALTLGAHDMHVPLVGFAGATATWDGLEDLYLVAVAIDDQVADVDDAIVAGVGAHLPGGHPLLCQVASFGNLLGENSVQAKFTQESHSPGPECLSSGVPNLEGAIIHPRGIIGLLCTLVYEPPHST